MAELLARPNHLSQMLEVKQQTIDPHVQALYLQLAQGHALTVDDIRNLHQLAPSTAVDFRQGETGLYVHVATTPDGDTHVYVGFSGAAENHCRVTSVYESEVEKHGGKKMLELVSRAPYSDFARPVQR